MTRLQERPLLALELLVAAQLRQLRDIGLAYPAPIPSDAPASARGDSPHKRRAWTHFEGAASISR